MRSFHCIIIAAGILLGGCDNSESTKQEVRDGAEKTGDALQRGAEKTGEALKKAAESTGEVINKTVDAASKVDIDVKVTTRPATTPATP